MPANSAKNISGVHFNAGSMVLPLVDLSDKTTGALLINSGGEKRLLPGSRIKSSFIPITHHALSQTIIITEGFATGLVISRFVAATVVAAISAINLTHVAVALRGRYPDAQIILAADNDVTDSDHNPGKQLAELAALAVNGLVTLPPPAIRLTGMIIANRSERTPPVSSFSANSTIPRNGYENAAHFD